MSNTSQSLKTAGLLMWTLTPCIAMWVGLYELKSAVWAYVLYHLLCIVPAIWWGRQLWRPSVKKPKAKHCLFLLVAALLFSAGAVIGYELFGSWLLSNENVPVLLKQLGITRSLYVIFGLYATFVNPLFEEIFWRGVVLNFLEKTLTRNKYFGLVWSSLAYALFHYFIFRLVLYPGWAEIGTLLLAVYGAFLALIYRKTGSILTTALAHGLLTDLACCVLMLDYFRKFGFP